MHISTRRVAAGLVLAGGAVALRPGARANRWARHQLTTVRRHLRYLGGRLRGTSYRMRGRHPDPEVPDNVLADRIRSSLGALERRLDVPRIHVTVNGHVVHLHGEVGSEADADAIERAVAAVAGVAGVESHMRVGLTSTDTRPSTGRAVPAPSGALRRLLDATVAAGIEPDAAPQVVRGILATFADRVRTGERDHVAAHLPADVRAMFAPPPQTRRSAQPRTVHDLVARIVAATPELPPDTAEQVTAAVLDAFRSLVPEEAADVAAVLPEELRRLWRAS
jgi:uncharacterized protein (DUF2267 family)